MTTCACWQDDDKPSAAHSQLCSLHAGPCRVAYAEGYGHGRDDEADGLPIRVSGLPTENARLYAREFAAEQLRKVAFWMQFNGYDEAAVDHAIAKAEELWPV